MKMKILIGLLCVASVSLLAGNLSKTKDTQVAFDLGLQYFIGEGTEQNDVKAAKLFSRACDSGDTRGCTYLGDMHILGEGVNKNSAKSIALYVKACEAGDKQGCLSLGEGYEKGQGVKQNCLKASVYYREIQVHTEIDDMPNQS